MTDDFWYSVEAYKQGLFDMICFEDAITKQPFSPHRKQIQAMELMNDSVATQVGYGGSARGGKILANQGVILTPFGYKKGKDLKVGDLVNNPDGTKQKIIQIKPEVHLDKWIVEFRDGTKTEVAEDHLWQAWRGRRSRKINNKRVFGEASAEVVETRTLKEWIDKGYTPQTPAPKPQTFNRIFNFKEVLDPYLMGALLGDGCMTTNTIKLTCNLLDLDHFKDKFKDYEYSVSNGDIRFKGDGRLKLVDLLSQHDLIGRYSHDKFIPDVYKYAKIEDRLSIIKGMMDTDGTTSHGKNGVYYTTVSKIMADDLAFIIRSLGGIVTISQKKAGYKDKNNEYIPCRDAYELYIKFENTKDLLTLERKREKIGPRYNEIQKAVTRVYVEGKIKGRCITVSNPNGLYITNDFIVTHNSALIALDSIMCAYAYPECQNIIGRKSLVTLFETTWITLLRTLTNFGFVLGKDYKYDGKYHRLEFANKSVIIAKNLEFKPSDKEGTEYGSLEILRAYVDQSEHVSMKIIDKVTERAGSHYTASHYDIKGKVFEAFNPSTSHTKKRYWLPFKTETENEGRKFVRALPSDNPGKEAKKWVEDRENDFKNGIMPKIEYQKQILGNFDYDDNPNKLCGFDTINAIFENNQAIQKEKYYITADIARLGSDYARIAVWQDWEVVEFVCFAKSRTTDIKKAINALRIKYNIPRHLCIADEDGVGGGVVDECRIKGFVNGSKPIYESVNDSDDDDEYKREAPQYKNLKTQCLYIFARFINLYQVYISADLNEKDQQEIIEEIEQIQSWDTDDDGKLKVKPKAKIKEDIGHSPDWSDTLMMRCWFYLVKEDDETDVAVAIVSK